MFRCCCCRRHSHKPVRLEETTDGDDDPAVQLPGKVSDLPPEVQANIRRTIAKAKDDEEYELSRSEQEVELELDLTPLPSA